MVDSPLLLYLVGFHKMLLPSTHLVRHEIFCYTVIEYFNFCVDEILTRKDKDSQIGPPYFSILPYFRKTFLQDFYK